MYQNLKSVNIKSISEGLMSFLDLFITNSEKSRVLSASFIQVTKRTEKIKITRLSDYKKEDR